MADKKISQLTAAFTPLAGTEVLPIVQSGATKKVTAFELTGTTVDSFGNVAIANGNIVIGTSGKGIDFSATPGTGTSELFDDYEEGDWTPTFTRDTPPTFTYGTVVGKYTKTGDTVTVQGTMFFTVTSAGAGLCYIGSLPFTSNSTSGYSATGSVSYADCLPGGADGVYVGAGGATLVVTLNGNFPSTSFATGRLYFNITYKV